ncbi:MAG: Gfo/Idh/MocA family oxidoreductase [Kordiimonadaceae bacterium]|nr:Gfo/Idh/MocA family oxidoreductase [Kordiimonadaceae bacterium]
MSTIPSNSTRGHAPMRFGMVGGGEGAFIGEIHRLVARMDNELQLVCGAFSRDHANCLRTGQALALNEDRLYASYAEMLQQEAALPAEQRMQFVVIVTPNHTHVPIAKAALEQGFHVLSDKPASLNLAEAKSLQQTIQKTGLLYGLTHTYLGYPLVIQAKHMVADGAIGPLRRIMVEYPQGWLSNNEEGKGNKQASWRTDPEKSGIAGCLLDIGTHASTLLEYASGHRIKEVCADVTSFVQGRALDDDASILFRTDKGARGTLVASQICAGEENGLSIRLYGEKGSLEWRQMDPNSLILKTQDAPVSILRAGTDKAYLCDEAQAACRTPAGHPEGYLEAFSNIYADFVRNAASWPEKTNGFDRISINTGARAMAFVEAAVANSRSGEKWTALMDVAE